MADKEAAPDISPESRSGLDPWTTAELPAPPPSRGLNILGVIGPGAIILGVSVGSGEWLLGPAVFVKYGVTLLWVTTVAAFLQTVLNTEVVRYTLYTGEPVVTGFMRTRPRATFWAWFYAGLYFLHHGWPGWAGTAAGAIFYLIWGKLAGNADAGMVHIIGVGTFLLCVFILLFGRRIERTLEILNWILIVFTLGGFFLLCVFFASPSAWWEAIAGFFAYNVKTGGFEWLPVEADWFLIGAFAAYCGAGGVSNLTYSNWARDKGFGMGSQVGYIPAMVGGQKVNLASTGKIFAVNEQSLVRWREWWRIVKFDQWGIFFIGALLGMGLPAILYTSFIAPGTDIRGLSIAAALAEAMGARSGAALGFGVAFLGAWVLFKTQLNILEGSVRAITDILWTASPRVRAWRGGDVRTVYYSVMAIVVLWGVIALGLTKPLILLMLGANMAAIVMVISPLHLLYINMTLLPVELRPPMWRRASLVAMALFYGFFVFLWLTNI